MPVIGYGHVVSAPPPAISLSRWQSSSSISTDYHVRKFACDSSSSDASDSDDRWDELFDHGVQHVETVMSEMSEVSVPMLPMPNIKSMPIIKTYGRNLTLPEDGKGRIRFRSVDMRDVRYYDSDRPGELRIDGWEQKILNKLDVIRYDNTKPDDLVANFVRLYIALESVRDMWIIQPVYREIINKAMDDFYYIRKSFEMEATMGRLITDVCKCAVSQIVQVAPMGIVAEKVWK